MFGKGKMMKAIPATRKNYLLRLYKYAYKSSPAKLIAIGVFLPLIVSVVIVTPLEIWFPSNESMEGVFSIDDVKKPLTVISVILIAPLLETLIQYVPVWLSITYLSKFKYAHVLAICLTSAFFAWLHPSGSRLIHGIYNTILVCLMAAALIFDVLPEV